MKQLLVIGTLILLNAPAHAIMPGGCYSSKLPVVPGVLTQRIAIQPGLWQITTLDSHGQKIAAEEVCTKENEWQAFMHERAASGEEGCAPVKFTQTLLNATPKQAYLRVGYEETCQQGSKIITHRSFIDSAISTHNASALTQYQLTTTTSIAGRKSVEIQHDRYLRLGNCVGYGGEIVGE